MDNLTELKRRLREEDVPFFDSDSELQACLDRNNGDLDTTTYECLMIKAENTSLQLNGMTTVDTSKYFLRLAGVYRPSGTHTA